MNQNLNKLAVEFMERLQLTQDAFGRMVGYSGTSICKWLKGEFDGDLAELERSIHEGLKRVDARMAEGADLFDTWACEIIRKMGIKLRKRRWMGFGYGSAGIGKTCGANKLLLHDLRAVMITVLSYRRDRAGLTQLLRDELGRGDWGERAQYSMRHIEKCLAEENRLLIVDQAHLLNFNGRQYFCDLHDVTRCPILFLGNPEMITEWRESPQQARRLTYCESIGLHSVQAGENGFHLNAEQVAGELLRRVVKEADGIKALKAGALRVVRGEGHIDSLNKTLELTMDIRGKTGAPWQEAFEAAESVQTRNQFR